MCYGLTTRTIGVMIMHHLTHYLIGLFIYSPNPFLLFAHPALIRLSTNRLDESSSIHSFE